MSPRVSRPLDILGYLLAGFLCLIPCAYYFECFSLASLARPWYALGDIPIMCGYFQAFAEGEGYPFIPHFVSRLNAPFTANWADFPTTEELIWAFGGVLTRLFGVITAYNLCILSAHISAGLALYFCARKLGSDRSSGVLAAFSYSASRFLFIRDAAHIVLSVCWHLPFYWLATNWLWQGRPLTRKHWGGMLLLSWLAAWQNPYFWYAWMVMLVPCWLHPLILKQWRRAYPALVISAASLFFLVLAHVDTLVSWMLWGRSAQTFSRTINELQIYGMRLPELFLPCQHHLKPFDQWAQQHYYQAMLNTGFEMESHYLGVLGVLALLHLMVVGLVNICRLRPVPFACGMSLWIMAVAICGGLNMCAGSFGLLLFRCTCRFSVLLLAGSLLHLATMFTEWKVFRGRRWLWLFLIIPVSGLDTMPPRPPGKDFLVDTVKNQRAMAEYLEKSLPAGSTVFQWPVMAYPEGPKFPKLEPYEQLYAYVFTKNMHFSYGDCRGRPESQWQLTLSSAQPERLFQRLESYGFSAFVLYRLGMSPEELNRWDAWSRKPDYVSPWNDLWVYRLHPSATPVKPPLIPSVSFGPSFNNEEHDNRMRWHWAFGDSKMEIIVPKPCPYLFQFGLSAMGSPSDFRVYLDGRFLTQVQAPAEYAVYRQMTVDLSNLPAGVHRIRIEPLGSLPGRLQDGARLSFQLINPTFERKKP